MHAAFLPDSELDQWHDVEVLPIGMPSGDRSVAAQVGVTKDSGSRLRVDIQASAGYSCFQEVRCFKGIAYIGFGQCVFVVHPENRVYEAYPLDGYFGHLCTAEELEAPSQAFAVLAGSASELLSFSVNGKLCWRTGNLGIDGVIVLAVRDGVVHGSGEWDPPGGWRPFRLAVDTGEKDAA
jgi:hypothetical protein